MSVLRNLEAKLGGLVEGAFGRAFKTSVQPVELAHKLAKEMEDNQMVSVSRVYVPNHYRVFLSPELGEFGIQAQLLSAPEEESEEAPAAAPSAGDFGHTMVYSPDREARPLEPLLDRRKALLVGDGRRSVLSGSRALIGRSRECDIALSDPNVSRRHAELRRGEEGWSVVDLGSTNGVKVNGRRVEHAPLRPGDRITIGVTDLTFELD
jgi:hypothetical protein